MAVSLGADEIGVSYLVIYLMTTTEANTNEKNKTHCTAHTYSNDTAIPTIKKPRFYRGNTRVSPTTNRTWKKSKK